VWVVLSRTQNLSVTQLVVLHDATLIRVPASCDVVQVGSIFAEPVVASEGTQTEACASYFYISSALGCSCKLCSSQIVFLTRSDGVRSASLKQSIASMVVCLDKMSEGCHINRNNETYQCKRSSFHYFTLHTHWPVISIGNEFRAVLKILFVKAT
jgi:hypothetical protein